MSISPNAILDFAESLADSNDEVVLRSSISRAYYAAFHFAREYDSYLPVITGDNRSGGTHKQLINRFCHIHSDKRLRAIGYILSDMCKCRESADYDLKDDVTSIQALSQIETDKRLLGKLLEFSATQEKEQA